VEKAFPGFPIVQTSPRTFVLFGSCKHPLCHIDGLQLTLAVMRALRASSSCVQCILKSNLRATVKNVIEGLNKVTGAQAYHLLWNLAVGAHKTQPLHGVPVFPSTCALSFRERVLRTVQPAQIQPEVQLYRDILRKQLVSRVFSEEPSKFRRVQLYMSKNMKLMEMILPEVKEEMVAWTANASADYQMCLREIATKLEMKGPRRDSQPAVVESERRPSLMGFSSTAPGGIDSTSQPTSPRMKTWWMPRSNSGRRWIQL